MSASQVASGSQERSGLLPSVVYLALDVADRSGSTAVALLQDGRAELRAAADGAIEATENATRAAFRFARKVTQRLDEASAETLASFERIVHGAVKSARETTRAAAVLATTATGGVVDAGARASA
ncbi:MAG: hypothetical protein R3B48_29380 [Kofleriaceae bacterium]